MNDTGFTPTLSQVRQAWAYFQSESRSYMGSPGAEFNRWLDSVKAEVWRSAYVEGFGDGSNGYFSERNPYRQEK